MSDLLCAVADWPWPMIEGLISIASLFATVTIGLILIRDIHRLDRPRRPALKPGVAHFIVPANYHHPCDFTRANEHEHRLKVITLPSCSTRVIDLYIETNILIRTQQVYFGFAGKYADKPYFTEIDNRFITAGPRRIVVPGKRDNQDYRDKHKFYHAVEDWSWSIGDGKTYGFKITTCKAGRYKLEINFLGDISAGRIDDLVVLVEDDPTTLMRCVRQEHQAWGCSVGLRPL